jgi:hypothetical protein
MYSGEDAMLKLNFKTQLALTGVLLAFTLGVSGTALAGDPATFDEALALATKQNKVLVVDFYTDW